MQDASSSTPKVEVLHAVLRSTQRRIETLYALEPAPDVTEFTVLDPNNEPEQVLVRESADVLELRLSLPANLNAEAQPQTDDHVSLVEGVSHFIHLAERCRTRLSTSHLELELQAEVDKFVLLWEQLTDPEPSVLGSLHEWLFTRVSYLDEPNTVSGERYRFANRLAARFCGKLLERARKEDALVAPVQLLRHFYRCGLTEKIYLTQAA